MTTKPRAKKFRIRRGSPLARDEAGVQAEAGLPGSDDQARLDQDAIITARAAQEAGEQSPEQGIADIRKEGLTGRQLRMARRIAQRHGVSTTSDYDAVRQLRARGIDPFKRSNLLELVDTDQDAVEKTPSQLPQVVRQPSETLPSPVVRAEEARASEIGRIQRDIGRRRRRKMLLLAVRLLVFVMLPTVIAGYYYTVVATPLYATNSAFVIQKSEVGDSQGLGLFSGTQLATSQDSLLVQNYLQSRAAMIRLDEDHGFVSHFSQEDIDPITRLPADASREAAYKTYGRNVTIAFDPTEGIVKMEVVATDPDTSVLFSTALISYAEEVVDNLSTRLRDDQMAGARKGFEEAETYMQEAQQRVIGLQERYSVISADVEVTLLTQRIGQLEARLTQEMLNLAELNSNTRPNQALVNAANNRIATLEQEIAGLRAGLTSRTETGESLARIASELAIAQAELETRNLMLQGALQALEAARTKADSQTRYLSNGVPPVAPDEATYPRAFEKTMLAFLILSGIYLMISLTASVLREQVSS